MRAHCSECGGYVELRPDGLCEAGHPRPCLRDLHDPLTRVSLPVVRRTPAFVDEASYQLEQIPSILLKVGGGVLAVLIVAVLVTALASGRQYAVAMEELRSRTQSQTRAGFAQPAPAPGNTYVDITQSADTEPGTSLAGGGWSSDDPLAGDGGQYLGRIGGNDYASDSMSNPYGAGSKYSADSVNNPYGRYGSRYSTYSARNPYATNAPALYDSQGNYRGRLSANPYDSDSTSNPYGRYGSRYSADSINNPYGAGNPYGSGLSVYGE